MTEEAALEAYRARLERSARKHAPHTFEDALSDAKIEFLLALRSYYPAYHGAFWKDYAYPKVRNHLKTMQKAESERYCKNAFSLDAAVSEESETTYGQFLLVESAKVTGIELREMISQTSSLAQKVGWRIIEKDSPEEIQTELRISAQSYQECLMELKQAWENYNRDCA